MSEVNHTCIQEDTANDGTDSMGSWETIWVVVTLSSIIILTIIGNILVILSVFIYKPLRIVQNFFIVSLAVADLTVALLVMPLNVIYSILGRWIFGIDICKMWLTSDVMCCTASILNLCAIALDRFWAITNPINYAQKRTVKRVLLMIAGVWILSLSISSPPLMGWNDWPQGEEFQKRQVCKLSERQGYVIYSSLGSFYIPLFIMTIVYIEIFIATRRRLREKAHAAKINATTKHESTMNSCNDIQPENKSMSSENENEISTVPSDEKPIKMSDGQRPKSAVVELVASEPKMMVKKTGFMNQFIEEKQRISLSKERRAARILGIIMGVFVVCWLPFFLMYIIIPFCPTCCPSKRFINFITWLGYINSVLNPIIYTIFNIDFRRAFRKILTFRS